MTAVDPQPLPGGHSGETFVSGSGGQRVVLRIYAGRSRERGPEAPEVDAAVLRWLRGLLPVPEVLEVRTSAPGDDVPGLLVTSFLPGVLLSDLLPTLAEPGQAAVGRALGTLLGRLAHVALPTAGRFGDRTLAVRPWPPHAADLPEWAEARGAELAAHGWSGVDLEGLRAVADRAATMLDTVGRTCLVHGDLNPKNLLLDAETLEITGLVDWEFAHAGSPYSDLGNLLRHERRPVFADAVLTARERFVPDPRPDALDLARAADLMALIDLAAREGSSPPADRAAALLRAVVRAGDLHASEGT